MDAAAQKMAGKYVLPIICVASMGLATIVGTSILNRLDRIEQHIGILQIDMAVVKTDLRYMKARAGTSPP